MLTRMRKSLAAVTVCGSSDFGSAIWPTTSTPGGVCARAMPGSATAAAVAVAAA